MDYSWHVENIACCVGIRNLACFAPPIYSKFHCKEYVSFDIVESLCVSLAHASSILKQGTSSMLILTYSQVQRDSLEKKQEVLDRPSNPPSPHIRDDVLQLPSRAPSQPSQPSSTNLRQPFNPLSSPFVRVMQWVGGTHRGACPSFPPSQSETTVPTRPSLSHPSTVSCPPSPCESTELAMTHT